MPTNEKQAVAWAYELDKEALRIGLEKRGLSICGNILVVRQRLQNAMRPCTDPL